MELGIGSDDDLFSEEKDTTFKEESGWIAKQCESEVRKKSMGHLGGLI